MALTTRPHELYEREGKVLRYHLHPGQTAAWDSEARFTFVIAGTQSGKTSFGPIWLHREIRLRGTGDYMVVAPTFPLLQKKVLPEFKRLFVQALGLGEYRAAEKTFVMDGGATNIFFGHATDPDSLESATAKGAWLDECGQNKFALPSFEAILRRLSIHQGRVLGTTTPYNLGWLKTQVYDRWRAKDPNYKVVQFKSIHNPLFPRAEYERARDTLPGWKFDMFYNGRFTRPAAMIYGSFDFERHVIPPFAIPPEWPRYGGLDFGGVNTAAVGFAENPANGYLYLFAEYHRGERTAAEHVEVLKPWNCGVWYGGAKSEDQWRREMTVAGLPIGEPRVSEVEVGIGRVFAEHKQNKLYVFDTCHKYLDQKGRYAREIGPDGEPTEKIEDKETFHLLDAERYVVSSIRGDSVWYFAGSDADDD